MTHDRLEKLADCSAACLHPEYRRELAYAGYWATSAGKGAKGGLTKGDMMRNKDGKLVSIRQSQAGQAAAAQNFGVKPARKAPAKKRRTKSPTPDETLGGYGGYYW